MRPLYGLIAEELPPYISTSAHPAVAANHVSRHRRWFNYIRMRYMAESQAGAGRLCNFDDRNDDILPAQRETPTAVCLELFTD